MGHKKFHEHILGLNIELKIQAMSSMTTDVINNETWCLDKKMVQIAENAICLTGTARSGTTLLGSLIHSMDGVEYSFEPPTICNLFLRIQHYTDDLIKRIYTEYIYEEILMPAISGRNLNFNPKDWSYIFNVKSLDEIRSRYESGNRIRELYESSTKSVVAYKIPNITQALTKVLQFYPRTRIVVTARNPDEVAQSVMERKWYHGDELNYMTTGPIRKSNHGNVPACLVGISEDEWINLDEIERCHAIYVGCYQEALKSNCIIVDYHSLLLEPQKTTLTISEALGLKWGKMTEQVVRSVRNPKANINKVIRNNMPWREKALEIYNKLSESHGTLIN
jgi:hypothetical protein